MSIVLSLSVIEHKIKMIFRVLLAIILLTSLSTLPSNASGWSCQDKIKLHCESAHKTTKGEKFRECVRAGTRLGACPDGRIGIVEPTINNAKELPKHKVLERINLLKGGVYLDIHLKRIPSSITKEEFAKIANTFYRNEKADYAFYKTKKAYKANWSSEYSTKHPNALKKGFLGSISNGVLAYGEYFDE